MNDLSALDSGLRGRTELSTSRCAVLIPHYNNPEGLLKSLSSIGKDEAVDVWVVDDGSQRKPDETAAKKAFDGRIRFGYLPRNQGIQFALNAGLVEIEQHYEYVARLDCGDTCAPNRFRLQMEFLDNNPKIMLLGSAVTFVDTEGDSPIHADIAGEGPKNPACHASELCLRTPRSDVAMLGHEQTG